MFVGLFEPVPSEDNISLTPCCHRASLCLVVQINLSLVPCFDRASLCLAVSEDYASCFLPSQMTNYSPCAAVTSWQETYMVGCSAGCTHLVHISVQCGGTERYVILGCSILKTVWYTLHCTGTEQFACSCTFSKALIITKLVLQLKGFHILIKRHQTRI